MADQSPRACAVCRAPLTDDRSPPLLRNRLVSPKRYCSPKCTRRAYYLRRRERDASRPVLIESPAPVQPDGWPDPLASTSMENMRLAA